MFLNSSTKNYHEIGFYFITKIPENKIPNEFKSLDGDSAFVWITIQELIDYPILTKPIKQKIINNEIVNEDLEHLVYQENNKVGDV